MVNDPKSIELTKGHVAIVDAEDYERVSAFTWSANETLYTVYGQRVANKKTIMLHRFIMNAIDGMDVAHLDGNGLNCQKHNMRVTTRSLNIANSPRRVGVTGYRGVTVDGNRFVAKIRNPVGKREHIGMFRTVEEAARAYDAKAREYHGEFAVVNFDE